MVLKLLIKSTILMILISIAAACSPISALQPAGTGTPLPPGSVQQRIEQIEEALPTRTPAPTPVPSSTDQIVSGILEEIGISDQEILGLSIEEWASIITGLLVFALIYIIGLWLVRIPLLWLVRRTSTDFDDQFFSSVASELRFLVLVFSLDFMLGRTTVISDDVRLLLNDIFFILYLLIFISLLWRLARFTECWYRDDLESKMGKDRYDSIEPLIMRSTAVVLAAFGLVILLEHFGFQVSSVMVVGLVLLITYIAVKFVIADAVNGFIILFDQPFRVGDRVKIQSMDTWGEVIEIGTRTTHVKTFDNRVIVVPNSLIANQQLDNYTYPDSTYRMHVDVGIKFGSDIQIVEHRISSAVTKVNGVLSEPSPEVLLIEFGESGLIFRVRWWVPTQTDFYVMSNKINKAIIDTLSEAGIAISFTSLNVINFQPESEEAVQLSIPGQRKDTEAS